MIYIQLYYKLDYWQRHNPRMINPNLYTPDRSNKLLAPGSPVARRKNIQFSNSPQIQTITNTNQYSRKELNLPQTSPQHHYYTEKVTNGKTLDASIKKQFGLQSTIRELSDRIIKMSQKLSHHEAILIKMTENSVQNNKQEFKKNNKMDSSKSIQALNDSINKIRKDFQDYKSGNIQTREIQIKNQLFSQLIHKSQERMKEEMQSLFKKSNQNPFTNCGNTALDQKIQQIERTIHKLQLNSSLNSNKIFGAHQKIEEISSSLDGHIDLINAELNKAINKIVSFVNEKVSKPLNENIVTITERIQKLQLQRKMNHFGGMKVSGIKSQKSRTVAQYKQVLTAYNQQIIISEKVYYIDIDGYLLDEQFYYLLNKNEDKIRLDQTQIKILRNSNLIY